MAQTCSRRYLLGAAGGLLPLALLPLGALARPAAPCELSFLHTHTGERLDIVYAENGAYIPAALQAINRLLRDFRSDTVHPIDPALLDILHGVRERFGGRGHFEVISGFRSAATNAMLHRQTSGVASNSLHLYGRAIDVRLSGTPTRQLQRAALAMERGGVGFYPGSDFVHLDTGRVRAW